MATEAYEVVGSLREMLQSQERREQSRVQTALSGMQFAQQKKMQDVQLAGQQLQFLQTVNTQMMTSEATNFLTSTGLGAIYSEDDDGIDPDSQIGTTAGFLLDEYNMNFTAKTSQGNYGHRIQNINFDETTTEDFKPAERTHIPATAFPLSSTLYDDNVKSVFSTSCEPEAYVASNQKRRVFNQRMTAANVVAVPGLGCGYSIEIESGGSDLSRTKTDTSYIVANINHKFIMHDGEHQYSQDIGLIRE